MRLSESEWQIMNALWEDHPATAREVSERLPETTNWAYTTIKTMLTRLAAKGAVRESKRANTSLYEPLVSKRKARKTALGRLVEQAFGGSVEPMMHFLVEEKRLSAQQRRELVELLEREDERGEGSS